MKRIDVLGGPSTAAVEPAAILGNAVERGDASRVEVNIVDPDSLGLTPGQWSAADMSMRAIVMRWHPPDRDLAPLEPVGLAPLWTLTVEERLAIGDRSNGAEPGAVKHITFLRSAVPASEFVDGYRHHVRLVAEHLPGIRRYVQNEVSAGTFTGRPIAAVSELTFASAEEYDGRWARGAAGRREFRASEGFLDLTGALQVRCVEHVVAAGP